MTELLGRAAAINKTERSNFSFRGKRRPQRAARIHHPRNLTVTLIIARAGKPPPPSSTGLNEPAIPLGLADLTSTVSPIYRQQFLRMRRSTGQIIVPVTGSLEPNRKRAETIHDKLCLGIRFNALKLLSIRITMHGEARCTERKYPRRIVISASYRVDSSTDRERKNIKSFARETIELSLR